MTDKEFKNLEVGKKFVYKEVVLEVSKSRGCDNCYFVNNTAAECFYMTTQGYKPHCTRLNRKDGKDVIFKEVE